MTSNIVMFLSGVLMIIAIVLMAGQREWTMMFIVVPIWLAVLGFWLYRRRSQ